MEGRRQQLQPFTTVKHSKLQQQQDSHSKALEERKQKKGKKHAFSHVVCFKKTSGCRGNASGWHSAVFTRKCLFVLTYIRTYV